MTLADFNLTPALLMDMVLVMVSALAVMYCAMLSRRLKRLNNLKTGLGASIVTLTEAIENTHKASVNAQETTVETASKLEKLLYEAESKAPKLDALITELENASIAAEAERKSIMQDVERSLGPALEKAQSTAAALLEVVQHVQRYKENMAQQAGENIVAMPQIALSRRKTQNAMQSVTHPETRLETVQDAS